MHLRRVGSSSSSALLLLGGLSLVACTRVTRTPRPTILTATTPAPPEPPPEPNEVRLTAVEMSPRMSEPVETAPSTELGPMARRLLDSHQDDFIRCYQTGLLENAETSGALEAQLDLAPDGRVIRVTMAHIGGAGMERVERCFQDVMQALQVRDAGVRGQYVSRVYRFSNPPVDLAITDNPVAIAPPPAAPRARPPRRGRTRGSQAAPATATAPAAPARPAAAPRLLGPDDVRTTIEANASALSACLAPLPARARNARGTATLVFDVDGRGDVPTATVEGLSGPLARTNSCVVAAVRAMQFRPSGTLTHVRFPLRFGR